MEKGKSSPLQGDWRKLSAIGEDSVCGGGRSGRSHVAVVIVLMMMMVEPETQCIELWAEVVILYWFSCNVLLFVLFLLSSACFGYHPLIIRSHPLRFIANCLNCHKVPLNGNSIDHWPSFRSLDTGWKDDDGCGSSAVQQDGDIQVRLPFGQSVFVSCCAARSSETSPLQVI